MTLVFHSCWRNPQYVRLLFVLTPVWILAAGKQSMADNYIKLCPVWFWQELLLITTKGAKRNLPHIRGQFLPSLNKPNVRAGSVTASLSSCSSCSRGLILCNCQHRGHENIHDNTYIFHVRYKFFFQKNHHWDPVTGSNWGNQFCGSSFKIGLESWTKLYTLQKLKKKKCWKAF